MRNKIIILLTFLLMIIILIGCNSEGKREEKYQSLVTVIKNGKAEDISEQDKVQIREDIIELLEHRYKDTLEIVDYFDAVEAYKESDYKKALSFINSASYDDTEIKEECIDLKKKIDEKFLTPYKSLLKESKFIEASDIVTDIDNRDYETLFYYALALAALQENDKAFVAMCFYNIKDFDISLDGELYKEIFTAKHEFENKAENEPYIRNAKPVPAIGMTENEVLSSRWGRPDDINTTETAYGTDEQWCYDGYGYVYLENGIVTAIQK